MSDVETPSGSARSYASDDDDSERPIKGEKRPSGGDWIPAKQTKRYKESHKATEKHRRDKINVSLGTLSDLVPQCKARGSKLDKLTILSETVEYIRTLRQSGADLGAHPSLAAQKPAPKDKDKAAGTVDQEWRRLLLSNIDDLLHVTGAHGNIVDVLPSCKPILGFEQSELLGRNLRTLLHPHDSEFVMLHLDNPDAQNIEYCARYLKKNGEYLWMIVKGRREGEGTNGAGGAGQASYVLAVGRVLELRNTHGYEAYDEFDVKYSLNGVCTYVSSNVRAVLGFAPADVIMKETSQLMDAEECARVWDDQIHRLETRSQLRVTHRMRTKCGEFRWLETVLWPFLNPISGVPEFYFAKSRTATGPFRLATEPVALAPAPAPAPRSIAPTATQPYSAQGFPSSAPAPGRSRSMSMAASQDPLFPADFDLLAQLQPGRRTY